MLKLLDSDEFYELLRCTTTHLFRQESPMRRHLGTLAKISSVQVTEDVQTEPLGEDGGRVDPPHRFRHPFHEPVTHREHLLLCSAL